MADQQIPELIIWDWYKTLSDKHLYQQMKVEYPAIYDQVDELLLDNPDIISEWAAGNLSYSDIHRAFSEKSGKPVNFFQQYLDQITATEMIRADVLNFIISTKKNNVKHLILIDNVEVWDEFFLPNYLDALHDYFLGLELITVADERDISTSWKNEVSHVLSKYSLSMSNILLVDDNSNLTDYFLELGGQAISHSGESEDMLKMLQYKFSNF